MKKTKSNKSFFKKELGHFKHIWSMMAANMEEKSKELGVPEEDIRLIEKRNSAIKKIYYSMLFLFLLLFLLLILIYSVIYVRMEGSHIWWYRIIHALSFLLIFFGTGLTIDGTVRDKHLIAIELFSPKKKDMKHKDYLITIMLINKFNNILGITFIGTGVIVELILLLL